MVVFRRSSANNFGVQFNRALSCSFVRLIKALGCLWELRLHRCCLLSRKSCYCSAPCIVWLTTAFCFTSPGEACPLDCGLCPHVVLLQLLRHFLFDLIILYYPQDLVFLFSNSRSESSYFYLELDHNSSCSTVPLRCSALLHRAPRGHAFHHLHICSPDLPTSFQNVYFRFTIFQQRHVLALRSTHHHA